MSHVYYEVSALAAVKTANTTTTTYAASKLRTISSRRRAAFKKNKINKYTLYTSADA